VSVAAEVTAGIMALHYHTDPCLHFAAVPGWGLCASEEEETPCEGGTRWLE
jgi:hypothetical protein